jgi:hypothetical protein
VYDVGGDDVMSLRQLLLALRASSEGVRDLSHPAWEDGPTVKVPLAMMKLLARTSDFAKLGPMDSDMLGMLVESADFEIGGLLDGFGFRPLGLRSALLDARG